MLMNLFAPAWREVLLLYMSMGNGGEVIQACLDDVRQPVFVRYLLAGRCLAEGGPLDPKIRCKVLDGL